MDTPQPVTHISLCAGYGGIDLGLRRIIPTLRTVAYAEIEAFACANLVSKMEAGHLDEAPLWPDLKTFPFQLFRGLVDILSGGFPCQPFSQAGAKKGDHDPRHLFPAILDGIRQSRPAIVFLENVDGIVSARLKGDHWSDPAGTPVLLHVLRELERVGYRATAIPSSASEIGAPHQRNRWFIFGVAIREGERCRGGTDSDGTILRGFPFSEDLLQAMVRSEIAGCGGDVRGDNVADPIEQGLQGGISSARGTDTEREGEQGHLGCSRAFRGAWPARPQRPQHYWEPPRVVPSPAKVAKKEKQRAGDADSDGGAPSPSPEHRPDNSEVEREVGGSLDGTPDRMGYARLCVTVGDHTDELRLLGNGVCPMSASDAFVRGLVKLGYAECE